MALIGEFVLRIVGRIDGERLHIDGEFVEHYDPTLTGGSFVLRTTPKLARAKGFAGTAAALEYYRQVCPNVPIREDGNPNRPLTAFTIALERAEPEDV